MNKLVQIIGIIGYVFMTMHYYDINKSGNFMLILVGYLLVSLHYLYEYLEECKLSKSKKHDEEYNKITKGGFLLILAHNLIKMYKTQQLEPSYLISCISIIAYLLKYNQIAYGLFTLYYFKYIAQHAHDQNSLIGGYSIASMYLYKLVSH